MSELCQRGSEQSTILLGKYSMNRQNKNRAFQQCMLTIYFARLNEVYKIKYRLSVVKRRERFIMLWGASGTGGLDRITEIMKSLEYQEILE